MRNWHYRTKDIGLRLGGAVLCGISYLAIQVLWGLHVDHPGVAPGMPAFAVAAAAFLSASLGATLVTLGNHVFDQVEVSARWRTRPPIDERTPLRDLTDFDGRPTNRVIELGSQFEI